MSKKRLMLLGGGRYLIPAVEAAHKNNIQVITADYLPDNYAHRFSDEYVNVSIIDKEAVLKVAQEKKIDGIMSFACDPGAVPAAYVAEKLGLPQTGPYESVCILQDKGEFRRFLNDNGFNTPWSKVYTSAQSVESDLRQIQYPVMVKPVDLSGSKGVMRIDDSEGLLKAFNNAYRVSRSKEVIVEEYLIPDGGAFSCDCVSINGKLATFHVDDQFFDQESPNIYTPAAHVWPSILYDSEEGLEMLSYFKSEINRLLGLLDMGTCIYNLEMRVSRGVPYIMEVSPRSGGNHLARNIEIGSGTKLIEASILGAIGEEVSIEEKPFKGYWFETILHSENKIVFGELKLSKKIKKYVHLSELWVKTGDEIQGFTGADSSVGQIILKFDDRDSLMDILNNIKKHIKIVGNSGDTP